MKQHAACDMWSTHLDQATARPDEPSASPPPPSSVTIARLRLWLLSCLHPTATRAISFADAAACMLQLSLDSSEVLWLLLGGGGSNSSRISSSVFSAALSLNHWKTVTGILLHATPAAARVTKHVTSCFFEVRVV
jgi:hypothetical protein